MRGQNNRAVGTLYEDMACDYLRERGYVIVGRNYYTRHGELDIIALDRDAYAIVEVKYRKNDSYGTPFDAITKKKSQAMRYATSEYLYKNGLSDEVNVRFDVIGITGEGKQLKITHLKDIM